MLLLHIEQVSSSFHHPAATFIVSNSHLDPGNYSHTEGNDETNIVYQYIDQSAPTVEFTNDYVHSSDRISRAEAMWSEIAAVRKDNEKLHAENQRMKHICEEKDRCLITAAHDLKNPLTGILYISNAMIAGECGSHEIQEFGQMLRSSTQVMFALISNLLDSNKYDSCGVAPPLTPIDSTHLLQHLVKNHRFSAAKKEIAITCELTANYYVTADMQFLRQAIDNLLSNAVKYSPRNSTIEASIRLSDIDTSLLEICVRDQGPGISDEDKKELFGKFKRLSAKPTGDEHSSGLGLSICKRLIELMNGTVRCESELGKGAAFIISLPFAEPETV
ncbi:MAG: HAMP domain-containing histidine kinase [Ignavibacteria bacterium]|nr:HAMP domain-containing histidine kinase [Ignavibacteria bacterium]